mgnify:CR=1 FL=1
MKRRSGVCSWRHIPLLCFNYLKIFLCENPCRFDLNHETVFEFSSFKILSAFVIRCLTEGNVIDLLNDIQWFFENFRNLSSRDLSGESVAVLVPGITESCGERVTSSKI